MTGRTIWKFPLEVTDVQHIAMPMGARILHVASQDERVVGDGYGLMAAVPTMWVEVDPTAPKVRRLIAVVGTGHPAPGPGDRAEYVGTAMCGPFVWHVYDGGEV